MREGGERTDEGTPRTKTATLRGKTFDHLFQVLVRAGSSLKSNFQSSHLTEAPIICRTHSEFYRQPSGRTLKAAISGLMGENNGPFCRRQNPSGTRRREKGRTEFVTFPIVAKRPATCKAT